MTRLFRGSLALALTLAMNAGLAHADGDAANGEKVFAHCRVCHTVEAGKNKIGPSLAGIIGKKSGAVAHWNYSEAMKNSGLTWDEATLDTFLTDPKKLVPGTKMGFEGLPKEQDRLDVIAYLKSAASQ